MRALLPLLLVACAVAPAAAQVELTIDPVRNRGLNGGTFARCLTEHRFAREVEADRTEARALGLTGTPAFLINGRVLMGAQPIEAFRTAIDGALQRGSGPTGRP